MKDKEVKKVKKFWQERARQKDVPHEAVTHRDIWQRWLEIEMIKRFLKPKDRVLDVGCGNGYTTKRIAHLVRGIIGIDYSKEMIKRALKEENVEQTHGKGQITFQVKDVTKLSSSDFGFFDVAISERCLINLPSWKNQKKAIKNIASVLRPSGRFIFVEGSKKGRHNLNELRKAVGLEPMHTVWHNLDFNEEETLAYLCQFFKVKHELHFGVYDFVSRVVHPSLVAPKSPQYDSCINEVAARLSTKVQEFKNISRILFLVLEKM